MYNYIWRSNSKCIGGTMATPKKSEVGGTPDSTVAIMATTNFYSNCHSNCIHLATSAGY